MYFEKVKILNKMGIHAKIATQIIKITTNTKVGIFFEHNKKVINAKSIVAILASKIQYDDELKIFTDSERGVDIIKKLVELIEQDI